MTASQSAVLKDLDQMKDFARKFAAELSPGMSVGLSGPLGAGKTTFVRFLLEALGGTDEVSSPTYVLEHRYTLPGGGVVEHWDLYRISAPPEELFLPVSSNTIRLIEWSDKFADIQTAMDIGVTFEMNFINDEVHGRIVKITK